MKNCPQPSSLGTVILESIYIYIYIYKNVLWIRLGRQLSCKGSQDVCEIAKNFID